MPPSSMIYMPHAMGMPPGGVPGGHGESDGHALRDYPLAEQSDTGHQLHELFEPLDDYGVGRFSHHHGGQPSHMRNHH